MKRFLFRLKLNLKPILHSIIQIAFLLFFGWLENKMLEMTIIWCCFFIFRTQFEKQYHATTTWLCTLYSIAVFYIISLIAPSVALSILLIVAFTFTINIISFHIREYLDLKAKLLSIKGVKITKGMSKDVLISLIQRVENITELEANILIAFYCDRKSIQSLAFKYNYSYDRIWQLKNEALTKIKKSK